MLQETIQHLLRILNGWDRRLRLQTSLVWLPRGIMISLGLGLGLALVARLRPFLMPGQILVASLVAVGVGVITTLAVVWLRQHDALAMARFFDNRFGLKERLSTALELAGGGIRSPNEEIASRLLADTLQRAGQINAAAYLPLRLNWRDLGLALLLAAALGLLLFLPNPQRDALAQQQIVDSTIQQQVESLEGLREQIAANEALDEAVQRELMAALDETIEQLSRQEMSQEEAVATLSDLAEQLRQIAEQTPGEVDAGRQAMREALTQALQETAQALQEAASPQVAQAGQALAAGEPQSVADGLQGLAESLDEMSAEEQQALAEALAEAAAALAETDPALAESLQEAAEALEQGDEQAAREALDEAGARLGEMAQADSGAGDNPTRQIASQAAQQAEQSAAEVAQSGQRRPGSQPAPPQEGDSPSENTATRLQPDPSGQDGQTAPSGEVAGAGEGQVPGEGAAPGQAQPRQAEGGSSTSAGAGEGESSGEEGGFAASGEQIAQDNAPDGSGLTDYEPVFAPQSIGGGQGQGLQVSGSGEPGDEVAREGNFVEDPAGEAIVGYNEVFSDYANAAGRALERDYIPLTLRDVIRSYFASLEPWILIENNQALAFKAGPLVGMVCVLLLAGCGPGSPPAALDEPPQVFVTATPEVASATADPAAPTVLVTYPTDAGSLVLIRYQGGDGLCLAVTFDPQAFPVTRCGLTTGAGVGFVDSLPAPDGRVARVAFGLTPGEAVTAVAIEFAGGGNGPAVVAGGGYLLVLGNGQTPRRATAIDQYGYMAGQWQF